MVHAVYQIQERGLPKRAFDNSKSTIVFWLDTHIVTQQRMMHSSCIYHQYHFQMKF